MRIARVLASAMVALAAMTTLAACGGSSDPDDAPESGTPAATSTAEPIELEVSIENLQVHPTLDRVPLQRGSTVRLTVTSDEADTVHVHGVEAQFDVAAGASETFEFVVPRYVERGTYTVETHISRVVLFEIRIR